MSEESNAAPFGEGEFSIYPKTARHAKAGALREGVKVRSLVQQKGPSIEKRPRERAELSGFPQSNIEQTPLRGFDYCRLMNTALKKSGFA
jgi:hypothetical protein